MAWTDPRTWVNGEVPTQTTFNTHVRDNLRELWHEVAYVEFTATVTAAPANTEAAPLDVVSSGAITYVANPIIIIVAAPEVLLTSSTTGQAGVSLWDGATDLGRLLSNSASSATDLRAGMYATRRLTPTAASHTYKARLWVGAGSTAGVVKAGAGGVGTIAPGYIRILQKGGA